MTIKTQLDVLVSMAPDFVVADKYTACKNNMIDVALMIIKNKREKTGVTIADMAQTFLGNAARQHELNPFFSGSDNDDAREAFGFRKIIKTKNKHNADRHGAIWGLDIDKFHDAYINYRLWFSRGSNSRNGSLHSKKSLNAWVGSYTPIVEQEDNHTLEGVIG